MAPNPQGLAEKGSTEGHPSPTALWWPEGKRGLPAMSPSGIAGLLGPSDASRCAQQIHAACSVADHAWPGHPVTPAQGSRDRKRLQQQSPPGPATRTSKELPPHVAALSLDPHCHFWSRTTILTHSPFGPSFKGLEWMEPQLSMVVTKPTAPSLAFPPLLPPLPAPGSLLCPFHDGSLQ